MKAKFSPLFGREPLPQCWFCKHFDVVSLWEFPHPHCTAFPDGIPDEIFYNKYDHREPHPKDNGLHAEFLDVDTLRQQRMLFRKGSDEQLELEIKKVLAVLICVNPHPQDNE